MNFDWLVPVVMVLGFGFVVEAPHNYFCAGAGAALTLIFLIVYSLKDTSAFEGSVSQAPTAAFLGICIMFGWAVSQNHLLLLLYILVMIPAIQGTLRLEKERAEERDNELLEKWFVKVAIKLKKKKVLKNEGNC